MTSNDRMGEAVAAVVNESEAAVITRWIVLAEGVDVNGERAVWAYSAEDSKSWDSLGLLQYGIQREQAALTANEVRNG